MVKGKKTFIDRKKCVTFHLVHRSQHDPLVTDETAPQRVLLEAAVKGKVDGSVEESSTGPQKRLEEQRRYGIHYDDDYDYLQHLKKPERDVAWEYVENPNQTRKRIEEGKITTLPPKLQLPSSVFASEFEEDEGMLNKAAPRPGPRPDWDPDVVAALDDDFDYDNEANLLEDDFVLQAMDGESDEQDDEEDEECGTETESGSDVLLDSECDAEEFFDRLAPLMHERDFDKEETKSRFTEYSMSSSVMPRTEQLSLLDDRFERFFASYDDPEVGDLAMEQIEGSWGDKHPYVRNCFIEYKKPLNYEKYNKEWDHQRLEQYRNVVEGGEDPQEELIPYEVSDPKEKKWDCESILSTYSNIYNHPKLIEEPKHRSSTASDINAAEQQKIAINPKTGLPENVLRGTDNSQLTTKALSKLAESATPLGEPKSLCAKSLLSTLSVLSIRPKDETPDEKRERKRLIREYRSERRLERKANAEAFKDEKKRQTLIKLNERNNLQGRRIL